MSDSRWLNEAIRKIEADYSRSSDTHLFSVELPGVPDIQLYLKDESVHPTGSLKHRLARSLFLYALCNGWIGRDTTVVEASSGNTAVSEAYFAQLLGLKFIAVVPADTSPDKLRQIEFYGGSYHVVPSDVDACEESRRLAKEVNGHYMDQFTYAERATDWRGNNNVAESLFQQMSRELHPIPTWIVCSAGTGGTSATIGRYIRYRRLETKLCLADPERSVFYDAWKTGRRDVTCVRGVGGIEGIGRSRVEASFLPSVIDQAIQVPNAASLATIHVLERTLRRRYGGSTGTNVWAACQIIAQMRSRGERGSVVTVACDSGERYRDTYYDATWLARFGYDISPYIEWMARFMETGEWGEPKLIPTVNIRRTPRLRNGRPRADAGHLTQPARRDYVTVDEHLC